MITSQLVNDMLQIEFTDTECGMSSELQARFLEPLVTEGKPYGTGRGMAIVKRILDEHYGRIEVESPADRGTTIRIFFATSTNSLNLRIHHQFSLIIEVQKCSSLL